MDLTETDLSSLVLLDDELEPACDIAKCGLDADWWVVCRACDVYLRSWCDSHKRETVAAVAEMEPLRLYCSACGTQQQGLYRYERIS